MDTSTWLRLQPLSRDKTHRGTRTTQYSIIDLLILLQQKIVSIVHSNAIILFCGHSEIWSGDMKGVTNGRSIKRPRQDERSGFLSRVWLSSAPCHCPIQPSLSQRMAISHLPHHLSPSFAPLLGILAHLFPRNATPSTLSFWEPPSSVFSYSNAIYKVMYLPIRFSGFYGLITFAFFSFAFSQSSFDPTGCRELSPAYPFFSICAIILRLFVRDYR